MRKHHQHKKPKTNDAFILGSQCFSRGKLANPFKKNSFLYREWQRGFNTAYFENLKEVVH